MSDILANHVRLAQEIVQRDEAIAAMVQTEKARLLVAGALQEALERSIRGTDMATIERSELPQRCGLSADEIYALAHADRSAPLAEAVVNVQRVLFATGLTLGGVPLPVAVAA